MDEDCTDLFGPALSELLDCALAELVRCGREPGLAHIAPGSEIAWDNCCEGGGQLWVRLAEMQPYRGQNNRHCNILSLPLTIGVGVIRCAHTVDDYGRAPTAEQMTGDALGMTADASALLRAIECCDVPGAVDLESTRWRPLGPRGGCSGGEWTATLTVDWCGCP